MPRRRRHPRRPRLTTPVDRVRRHLDANPGWWTADALAVSLGITETEAAAAADHLLSLGLADVWATARTGRAWATTRGGLR